ncbi:MAG: ABC transporter ATP-binding protein [Pseudomonadota bacterium]
MAEPILELQDVSLSFPTKFGRTVVVKDCTFGLQPGQSLGLLGRNGAGKSSLLKVLSGSMAPTSGRVRRNARISFPLGFGGGFHGMLTGLQNARFVARIHGVDTAAMVDFVEDFSELGHHLHLPVNTYSSGMRARLAFAVSMGASFDCYLVDEITAVGDSRFREKCKQVFAERLRSAAVIMVSHSNQTLQEYCQTGAVLENGRFDYFSDIADAIAQHKRNMDVSAAA